ncbi:hypothetical protein V8C34DRAFT_127558 [Trichoderma compactum]
MTISHQDRVVCLLILPPDAVSSAIESSWHCLYRKYASHPTLSLSSLGKAWIRIQDEEDIWNSTGTQWTLEKSILSSVEKETPDSMWWLFAIETRRIDPHPRFSVPYHDDADHVCHGNPSHRPTTAVLDLDFWCTCTRKLVPVTHISPPNKTLCLYNLISDSDTAMYMLCVAAHTQHSLLRHPSPKMDPCTGTFGCPWWGPAQLGQGEILDLSPTELKKLASVLQAPSVRSLRMVSLTWPMYMPCTCYPVRTSMGAKVVAL